MKPYQHQIEKAKLCYDILKQKGYVYLAGKPRSGKTYTAILTCEMSGRINNVLVLTKKNAISGWDKFTTLPKLKHTYYVTNYEQVHKLKKGLFDLVIIDESHNIGAFPKPSKRWKEIKKLCYDLPHIHLSGTAIVESANSIYHQMSISKWTPFKYKNFYDFFRVYGVPYYIRAMGREIRQYDKFKPELLDKINEFTIYMTQEEAGIDIQATDKVHYVELDDNTKKLYNELQKEQIIELNHDIHIVCDTTMKLRVALHQIESGVIKVDDEYIELGNTEKIDYIKRTFGDSEDVGIMCHFIGERQLLQKYFKKAKIYSSNAHAEGVDLSHLKHFVILSSDYSGSKFIQRRDRIINTNGSNTTVVNHILVRKAISEQVYKQVSKKMDFNNSTYLAEYL